jgi:exodeoxyribonuclease V beta subunit
MTNAITYLPFAATTVPLRGSNLIEASAGTGKTYSIGILFLRLLLEKKMQVREILMVTFTKAAVAELEERIRKFTRMALHSAEGQPIEDPTIQQLVENAQLEMGVEACQRLLYEANLFMDEANVLTIHSFCQKTLSEFAFETRQSFGNEILQNQKPLLEESLNEWWRNHITTLPVQILDALGRQSFSHAGLLNLINNALDGKLPLGYDPQQHYTIGAAEIETWQTALANDLTKDKAWAEAAQWVMDHSLELTKAAEGNSTAKNNLLPHIAQPLKFVEKFMGNMDAAYKKTVFPEFHALMTSLLERLEKKNSPAFAVLKHVQFAALQAVKERLQRKKQADRLWSYNDLIAQLHNAVVQDEKGTLKEAIRNKYKAVFIDEFQDTDRLQFDLFQQLFLKHGLIFFIGDPKQSIYGWRLADIQTYFKARKAVDHVYGMNQNFRSSVLFIEGMNAFFSTPDPFYFRQEEDGILYTPVLPPALTAKGVLMENLEDGAGLLPSKPIAFSLVQTADQALQELAAQVALLLQPGRYCIEGRRKDGEIFHSPVVPNDIGVLVRSNKEGATLQQLLSARRIPAVTIGDEKILDTTEAINMLYLLQAFYDPTPGNIRRALLTTFTGFSLADCAAFDMEKLAASFQVYQELWQKNSLYVALNRWVSDFRIREYLLHSSTRGGERILANLIQLTELVHKMQISQHYTPLELIGWLQRGLEGMEVVGDEFEQRMESDEQAVRIVTIHKSKGLEYNIVLVAGIDKPIKTTDKKSLDIRQPNGEVFTALGEELSAEEKQLYMEQQEQEKRRLLYVAVTRAVYKVYLYRIEKGTKSTKSNKINKTNKINKSDESNDDNNSNKTSSITLAPFLSHLQTSEQYAHCWELLPPLNYAGEPVFSGEEEFSNFEPLSIEAFQLPELHWRRMSFTALAAKHEIEAKPLSIAPNTGYDYFLFQQLRRGAQTGNLLHYLFENIHFNQPNKWQKTVDQALQRFAPTQAEVWREPLVQLLHEVMETDLQGEHDRFQMASVLQEQKIAEFEFDFIVQPFMVDALNALSRPDRMIAVKDYHALQGIMNGKIDLFFQFQQRYYVLDWKSNYLGDRIEDYIPEKLNQAMNENNYHLQYLIYTVALKKYLQHRLGKNFSYQRDFGGVFYLFVRGVRKNNVNGEGVFYNKPEEAEINRLEQLFSGL